MPDEKGWLLTKYPTLGTLTESETIRAFLKNEVRWIDRVRLWSEPLIQRCQYWAKKEQWRRRDCARRKAEEAYYKAYGQSVDTHLNLAKQRGWIEGFNAGKKYCEERELTNQFLTKISS